MQDIMPSIDTPDNHFHNGNPLTGARGTIVPADWLNNVQSAVHDVQKEIINVLAAVDLSPNAAQNDQLRESIKSLLQAYVLVENIKSAAYRDTGTAADQIPLNLNLRGAAYRNIGTENGEIPDMSKFTSGTGWVRFPNGFLIQGGLLTTESHGGRTIPFPVAFTNKPFFITVVPHGYGAYDSMIHVNAGAVLTNTYFQCYGYYQDANGFRKDVIAFSWSAAGF